MLRPTVIFEDATLSNSIGAPGKVIRERGPFDKAEMDTNIDLHVAE